MKKLLSSALVLGVISTTSLTPMAFADVSANTLPSFNNGTNVDVTTTGNNMNIKINGGQGGVGVANFNSYNIGSDASVNYEFSAHNQTALNQVAASGGLSQIYGKITNSGCSGCGYAGTGKIILINPNGVLFGDGANVNVNSFTVSTMNGTFNKDTNTLELSKADNNMAEIKVLGGANIYGDKNVTLAGNVISTYAGSKISTNIGPNVGNDSYGKVKLVTADGVNFGYYNNGAVKNISNVQASTDRMFISLNGDITSGNIDARNYSVEEGSEINIKGATLKAVKAVTGNDGNIWLTAYNKAIVEDSKFETSDQSSSSVSRAGGNVSVTANKKVSFGTTDIDAVGNVTITSNTDDVSFNTGAINRGKGANVGTNTHTIGLLGDVTINAGKVAAVQNSSEINGNKVTIKGGDRAQVLDSNVNAYNDVNLISDGSMVWTRNAKIKAQEEINATANNGYLTLKTSEFEAGSINLTSKDNVTSARLNGSEFKAENKINVESTAENVILTSTNQFKQTSTTPGNDRESYLSLKGAKNVELNYADDLSTARMDLEAGKYIVLSSENGSVKVNGTTNFVDAEKIYITAKNDITTDSSITSFIPAESDYYINLNNIQTNLRAGRNIDVKINNASDRNNGLIAESGNDMTITTPDTLSVSSLISGKDMTINAPKVIAGLPYTTEQKLPGDPNTERSYIKVEGTFTSNVTNDNYTITESGDPTNDGNYNQKHHIQYGDDEKILLVNKRPVDNNVTDPNIGDPNKGQAVDVEDPENDDNGNTGNTGNNGGNTGNTGNTGNNGGNTGNNGGNTGNNGGNTGNNGGNTGNTEPCDETPETDTPEDEDTPTFGLSSVSTASITPLSINNLLNYTQSTAKNRK